MGGDVGKEGFDFGGAHLGGVAFVVEEDEAADPLDVGLFGAVGVVAGTEGGADAVEQFGFGGGVRHGGASLTFRRKGVRLGQGIKERLTVIIASLCGF